MLREVILLLASVITATNQQCFSENDAIQFVPPSMLKPWVECQHNFSISLLKVLNEERSGFDIAISPACIYESLLVAYFGASGKTEAALAQVLQIPSNQKKGVTWRFYKNQKVAGIQDVNNPYPLILANKMYFSKKLNLRPCMKEIFKRELEIIDYRKNTLTKAMTNINKWVEKTTHGQIRSLVTDLSPNATATLINAAYFSAKWEEEFKPEGTRIMPFRVTDYETRKILMMRRRSNFDLAHLEDIEARVLLVPYRKNRIVMAYILPDNDLEETIVLLDGKSLDLITDKRNYKMTMLDVFIPKIAHSTKMDLVDILQVYGIEKTFTQCANFSGFTGRRDVFLNSLIHQSVIEVNEMGTQASESSFVAYSRNKKPGKPLTFILDRPFAYVIYDLLIKKTLFIGTFRDPEPVSRLNKARLV